MAITKIVVILLTLAFVHGTSIVRESHRSADIGSDGFRLRDLKSMPPGVKECTQGYEDCYKKCYKNCKISHEKFGWECDPDALSLPERDQCLDLCNDQHEECWRKLGITRNASDKGKDKLDVYQDSVSSRRLTATS